jgi:hypothetical protein
MSSNPCDVGPHGGGVGVGVPAGIGVEVGVGVPEPGVGVGPQLPLTLNTKCMFVKPRSAILVGFGTEQAGALI